MWMTTRVDAGHWVRRPDIPIPAKPGCHGAWPSPRVSAYPPRSTLLSHSHSEIPSEFADRVATLSATPSPGCGSTRVPLAARATAFDTRMTPVPGVFSEDRA